MLQHLKGAAAVRNRTGAAVVRRLTGAGALGLAAALTWLLCASLAAAAASVTLGQAVVGADETVPNLTVQAGQAVVDGTVTGDVDVRLGEAIVSPTGRVAGDLVVGDGQADVRGQVAGQIRVSNGQVVVGESGGAGSIDITGRGHVEVDGQVAGDIHVHYGVVTLNRTAAVTGTVWVERGQVKRADGATVGNVRVDVMDGDLRFHGPRGWFRERGDHFFWGFGPPWGWSWLHWHDGAFGLGRVAGELALSVGLFLIGLIVIALWPNAEEGIARGVAEQPLRSFAAGVLSMLLLVPVVVLLAVTLIGIPLAVLTPFAWVVIVFLGQVAVAHTIGRSLRERLWPAHTWHVLGELALGVALLGLIGLIPFAGSLLVGLAGLLGAGAVLVTRFGSWRPWFNRGA